MFVVEWCRQVRSWEVGKRRSSWIGKEPDSVPSNFGRTVLTDDATSEISCRSTDSVLPSFVMDFVLK